MRPAMAWLARYRAGGQKGFVLPRVEWPPRSLPPTLKSDTTGARVGAQAVARGQRLGLPDFRHLATASAFTGGGTTARRFGVFVRRAWSGGMELLGPPPAAPTRTGRGEVLNGWGAAK